MPTFTPKPIISSASLLLTVVCLASLTCFPEIAQTQTKFPEPVGYVNDFANVIPADIEGKIDSICREVKQKTGAEIVVVSVETVGDEHYTEYANKLFEAWGIGEKGKDDGILLFNTIKERRFRLEVGYGLEPVITDGTAGEIRDNYVFPYFRRDDYGRGFLSGTQAVASLIARDAGVELTGGVQAPAKPERSVTRKRNVGSKFFKFIMLALFFFFFFGGRGGRGRGRRRGMGGVLPWLLLGGMMSGGRSHHSGGGFGGGFGGGGGFSGGFGGFGGGMSGGGGAGGGY